MDAADPLARFADEFHHPHDAAGRKLTYLCGHSLGLQPKRSAAIVQQELQAWQQLGVLGHHDGARPWITYHEQMTRGLAALGGALDHEVVAMNSLTINLHLMMVSFFRPDASRNRLLIEQTAFPSDRYAVSSQLHFHGLNAAQHLIEVGPRANERTLTTEDIVGQIERAGASLALVLLPGVQYLTGQALEIGPIAAAARRVGARIGLDLAHSIGNTPLRLHEWDVDFAVWCSYKYLNGGPGAIGGCFVHERHAAERALPRFAGWWGHDKSARFLFEPEFKPIYGAEGWQTSNPPILSSAPLIASLELFERAGMGALRAKSAALTAYMQSLIRSELANSVEIITPPDATARGCQLSVRILRSAAEAHRCIDRLRADGVIVDWREPDILRLAPVPLYNSFSDVFESIRSLAAAVHA